MRCLLPLASVLTLAAQEPRFDVQSRLVLVPVTVTDAKGQPVGGLDAGDFVLLDNGRPRQVTLDTAGTGVAPVALVVAIQASGISEPVLEKVRTMGSMIQPLVIGERGCAAVVSFSERVIWQQECTNDEDKLQRAFARVRPGEDKSGRMLDAVLESVDRLRQHDNSRRVLLLISESRDRSSSADLDRVATAIQNAGVTVYTANYSAFRTAWTTKSPAAGQPQALHTPERPPACGPPGCPLAPIPSPAMGADILGGIEELIRLGKTNTSQALATATGGTTLSFTRRKALEAAIQKLGEELHSQYMLSFAPDEATGGYHHLEVRVAGGTYQIRARPGYWSKQPVTPQ